MLPVIIFLFEAGMISHRWLSDQNLSATTSSCHNDSSLHALAALLTMIKVQQCDYERSFYVVVN